MGRDPEQLQDRLSGRDHPFRKNREKIELCLERQETFFWADIPIVHLP